MAYISTSQVKEMREKIKELFPSKDGWKISISRSNHSAVNCAILKAPIDLRLNKDRSYESVNQYSINRVYVDEAAEVLSKINKVLNTDNFDNSDTMTDYFHVGHYVNISIGNYDNPFEISK